MYRKLLSNFLYQASYQILLIILPIITIPIVSKALGPEGIGTFNFINSIVAYFVLVAGGGITNYGIREISIVRNDKEKLSKKFWELAFFNLIFASITFVVYTAFSLFSKNKAFFLVSSFTVLSCLFDISWFFSGIEDFKKITIRNFTVRIVSFILIIILIREPEDIYLYMLINAMSLLISQLSLWISINRYIIWVRVSLKDCLNHFKPAMEFFVAKIAISIYQNTTKTILGVMTTMTIVGYYSNSYALIMMAANIINAMNTIMIPRMSNMYGNKDEQGMIKLLQKTLHVQLYFTIAIMFGIIAISGQVVEWLFGPEFESIKEVIPWLAPVIVTQSFQMAVASQYLIPRKEMKEYNISIFIGAIITIVLTVLLVPYVEIYGAVFGINIGYLVVSYLRLKVLLRDTDFVLDYKNIIKYFFSGFLMWGIIHITTGNLVSSIFTTLIQILIGVTVYFVSTWALKINPIYEIISKSKSR